MSPWKFAKLNTFEKILLSQRLEDQSTDIIRHVQEAYLCTPTTRTQFDALYDTTIRGLGFDRDRQWAGRRNGKPGSSLGLPAFAVAPQAPRRSVVSGVVGGVVGGGVIDGGSGGAGFGGGAANEMAGEVAGDGPAAEIGYEYADSRFSLVDADADLELYLSLIHI